MICLWISKSAIYMLSPELNYIQVKFGVNPSISFEVTGQNVILYRWSILNGNGNGSSWLVLHFQVLLYSVILTWRHVAKSSHLAANVMTDRQTDRHTHTQTHTQTDKLSGVVKNIIPFKGIIIGKQCSGLLHYSHFLQAKANLFMKTTCKQCTKI